VWSQKISIPTPHGWLLEIPRGLGVSKAKSFKGKYEALTTGISRGVGVVQSKEPPMGEVLLIFFGTTQRDC